MRLVKTDLRRARLVSRPSTGRSEVACRILAPIRTLFGRMQNAARGS